MKRIRTSLGRLIVGGALGACLAICHAQTNLNFTQIKATSEGAIQLFWNSTTNEFYEIDYADELVDTNTGYINWIPLYTQYPSHGTSTFIADAGNYNLSPEIPHPKLTTQRFYRIALSGTNDSPSNPTVSVTSPTNTAILTGDIVVSVSSYSSELLSEVNLYVDGEQQWSSFDGTNFIINTCEWPNGPHIIFATAKSQSNIEGFPRNNPITYGRAVSPYVNVVFSNLITRFDLSENFFEPSEGQTQIVSAVFAANVNWVLEIQDASTNDVLYTTGSGATMSYRWDGTGTNGASIPDGIYTYLLTVQTNGLPIPPPEYGGGDTNPPPEPGGSYAATSSSTSNSDWYPTSKRQAIAAGWDHWYIQHPPMPPVKTNGTWVSWEDVYGPLPMFEFQVPSNELTLSSSSSMSMDSFTPEYAGQPSQNSRAPKRKPRRGVKNKKGTFGICYKTYPFGAFTQQPRTGASPPFQAFTGIDGGAPNNAYLPMSKVLEFKKSSEVFSEIMQAGAYKPKFIKADEQWGPQDIKKPALGGSSIFNTCDFGILMAHGGYGTNPELDGVKYIYFYLFDQKYGGAYVRLSDMDFGSAATHGLKWITLDCCNSLFTNNITSMANNSRLPDNDYLHLMLGYSSTAYINAWIHLYYASNLVSDVSIWNAWQDGNIKGLAKGFHDDPTGMTNRVTVRLMGLQSCVNDTIYTFNDPDFNTPSQRLDVKVFDP